MTVFVNKTPKLQLHYAVVVVVADSSSVDFREGSVHVRVVPGGPPVVKTERCGLRQPVKYVAVARAQSRLAVPWKGSSEVFVLGKVLGWAISSDLGSVWQGGGRKSPQNPGLQESFLSHGKFNRRLVGHAWPDEGDHLTLDGVGLGACFVSLRKESCFLGGFVEDMSNRDMPVVEVSGAWADCGVIKKRSRTWRHKGQRESWSKKGMRRRCREEVSWILLSTKLQGPGVVQGRSGPLGWIVPSGL